MWGAVEREWSPHEEERCRERGNEEEFTMQGFWEEGGKDGMWSGV